MTMQQQSETRGSSEHVHCVKADLDALTSSASAINASCKAKGARTMDFLEMWIAGEYDELRNALSALSDNAFNAESRTLVRSCEDFDAANSDEDPTDETGRMCEFLATVPR
jgi:hypothetical protein